MLTVLEWLLAPALLEALDDWLRLHDAHNAVQKTPTHNPEKPANLFTILLAVDRTESLEQSVELAAVLTAARFLRAWAPPYAAPD